MACLLSIAVSSCNFLDVVPDEFYKEEDLLADITQAEKEVAKLYNALPGYFHPENNGHRMMFSACSDTYHSWDQSEARLFDAGSWTAANNPLGNWENTYQAIRIAYHILENIDDVPIKNDKDRDEYINVIIPRYKGEAKFMIAYFYFDLLRRYGPFPIIDRYLKNDENEIALAMERDSVDDCVEFIVNLCAEAAEILPHYPDYEAKDSGRATKGAAMALKAKTLLYYASPLFNGGEVDGVGIAVNGEGVKTTLMGLKKSNGDPLFNTVYDKERWKRAADAAKEVLDLVDEGIYALHDNRPELFYTRNYTEAIFWKQGYYNNNTWERSLKPNGSDYDGSGALGPTQETVDCYETASGYPIGADGSGYEEDGYITLKMPVYRDKVWTEVDATIRRMYYNRDPRFYTDIFFHGQPYLHRYIYTEYNSANTANTDGYGTGKTGQNTRTGYYVKKWVGNEQGATSATRVSYSRNYYIFRLADVYLWYAEAMNEYLDSPGQAVYDAVNEVRKRVGMPLLPIAGYAPDATKAGMRSRIRNERRIELAFEEAHLFFDMRRWLVAHTSTYTSLRGMAISQSGDKFYVRTRLRDNDRIFKINHYLMPIPQNQITISSGLVQNYGWDYAEVIPDEQVGE